MKQIALFAFLAGAPLLPGQPTANCLAPPAVKATLPVDSVLSDQPNFNCFGWQEFIALNWRADPRRPGQPDMSSPASAFGSAIDRSPRVWETYKPVSDVFPAGGADPGGFGSSTAIPDACKADYGRMKAVGPVRFLGMLNANPGAERLVSSDISQAGSNTWLTAQNKKLTYYEERMNEDEFNYIKINGLYNALNQWLAMQAGGPGISLPVGLAQSGIGSSGAIEIKASWLPITDPRLYPKYLMSHALLWNPSTNRCDRAEVGLVGLHIIHKTMKAQQFAWATFEHVDNDPDANEVKAGVSRAYTYYNPKCDPATDHYQCKPNFPPCTGTKPGGGTCTKDPFDAPVQVVRVDPLPDYVNDLNDRVKKTIVAANPKSVFQYYRMINVLWPNQNTTIPPYALAPLTDGVPQPPNTQSGLLNTTMETYFQGDLNPQNRQTKLNCLSCHTFGAIAAQPAASNAQCTVGTAPGSKATGPCAASYSFALGHASCPQAAGCPTK